MSLNDKRMLIKIAIWYYNLGWTQEKIAKKLGIARSRISYYLQQARDEGIIEIYINDQNIKNIEMENQLEHQYNLDEVIIITTSHLKGEDRILKHVGKYASYHLKDKLLKINNLGLSWGKSVSKLVEAAPYLEHKKLKITPLIGGMGSSHFNLHSNQICNEMAQKMNCRNSFLYAPALVEDKELKYNLCKNKYIEDVLIEAKQVELAIVSIAEMGKINTMLEIGYLTDDDITYLQNHDIVGDINSNFFTSKGEILPNSINDRIIGLNIKDLQNIPNVVALVIGDHKINSLHAALKINKLINTLVTTDSVAKKLLKLDNSFDK